MLQNVSFFKKKIENIHISKEMQLITSGYCEVLNINLNIWFNIPSKYIENFCVIISVAVSILSERLTDTSCKGFSLCGFLWYFSSYG